MIPVQKKAESPTGKSPYIYSSEQIIEYYEDCKKSNETINNDYLTVDENWYLPLPAGKYISALQIATEMEEGHFSPNKYLDQDILFHKSSSWNLPMYSQPANEKGLHDLEVLLEDIRKLRAEIDKKIAEKNQKAVEINVEQFNEELQTYREDSFPKVVGDSGIVPIIVNFLVERFYETKNGVTVAIRLTRDSIFYQGDNRNLHDQIEQLGQESRTLDE